jgi:hypothetical protein
VVFFGYSGFHHQHDITEILLKVALNTIYLNLSHTHITPLSVANFCLKIGYTAPAVNAASIFFPPEDNLT